MIGPIRSWRAPDGVWYPSRTLPQFPVPRGELPHGCPGHHYWLAPDGSWFPTSTPPRYSHHHAPGGPAGPIGSDLLNLVEATVVVGLVLATAVAALLVEGILLIVGLALGLIAILGVGCARLVMRWRRTSRA
jgi:hypothetical protein